MNNMHLQGAPSARGRGRGWVDFYLGISGCLPDSAWADGISAEMADGETPKI